MLAALFLVMHNYYWKYSVVQAVLFRLILKIFTTTNTTVSLGTITIPGIGSQAIITGSVTNCSGGTVTNGYIIMLRGNLYERHNLSNTGTYSFSTLLCGNTNNITLIGEDITNAQQSNPAVYSLHPGNNVIPNIQACGVNTQQFINYTVNGIAYSFAAPADSVVSFEKWWYFYQLYSTWQ